MAVRKVKREYLLLLFLAAFCVVFNLRMFKYYEGMSVHREEQEVHWQVESFSSGVTKHELSCSGCRAGPLFPPTDQLAYTDVENPGHEGEVSYEQNQKQQATQVKKIVEEEQQFHVDKLAKFFLHRHKKWMMKPTTKRSTSVNPSIAEETTEEWQKILGLPTTGYHSFNATASDLVGVHRYLPDTRPAACKTFVYNVSDLPTASVIIPFHNEAKSTLLRTIHSILGRSPRKLLHEIILVDDASSFLWLQQPLTDYVAHFPKLRLIRLGSRQGLIRARMWGARAARGEVLFFLDAHVEVNTGWLEPVLARIKKHRNVLIVPNMDLIRWNDMQYTASIPYFHGYFKWNMEFSWKLMPFEQRKVRRNDYDPFISPVMVGCAHAIDRRFFFQTGAYDTDMEIWGGENIEHSFRLWMCGGRIETLPCSRVGHVFKPKLPYMFPGNSSVIIQRNLIRTAEVWMDDYKHYFYASQRYLAPIDMKRLEKRKRLRKRLKCKDFRWYLKNIIPEQPAPPKNAVQYGEVTLKSNSKICLYVANGTLVVLDCDYQELQDKVFYIDTKGRFIYKDVCIHLGASHNIFTFIHNYDEPNKACTKWYYTVSNGIAVQELNLCLELDVVTRAVMLRACNDNTELQRWLFSYNFDFTKAWDIEKVLIKAMTPPQNALYFGQLRNLGSGLCLSVRDNAEYEMVVCSKQPQYDRVIHVDHDGRLVYHHLCLHVGPADDLLISDCDPSVHRLWRYDTTTKQLALKTMIACMRYNQYESVRLRIQITRCDAEDPYQQWTFIENS